MLKKSSKRKIAYDKSMFGRSIGNLPILEIWGIIFDKRGMNVCLLKRLDNQTGVCELVYGLERRQHGQMFEGKHSRID